MSNEAFYTILDELYPVDTLLSIDSASTFAMTIAEMKGFSKALKYLNHLSNEQYTEHLQILEKTVVLWSNKHEE